MATVRRATARRSDLTLGIVQFCAEEVERQQDGPLAVGWMVAAWVYAMREHDNDVSLDARIVERLGPLVHPVKNSTGFRHVGVRVGSRICPPPDEVPRLVNAWGLKVMTPEEAYKEFQEIHPFRDGNGRTGKIVYNWLKGTLTTPAMPPNFFGCANP